MSGNEDNESRTFPIKAWPSGPYIPVNEIPNEIKKWFEKKKSPFKSKPHLHPPRPVNPDELRTLATIAQVALIAFVVAIIILVILIILISICAVADACYRKRQQNRRKEELKHRQRIEDEKRGLPRQHINFEDPPVVVVQDDKRRSSYLQPSAPPSSASISTVSNSQLNFPLPPPEILITPNNDQSYGFQHLSVTDSHRGRSLSRSVGDVYEEIGPPTAQDSKYLSPRQLEMVKTKVEFDSASSTSDTFSEYPDIPEAVLDYEKSTQL